MNYHTHHSVWCLHCGLFMMWDTDPAITGNKNSVMSWARTRLGRTKRRSLHAHLWHRRVFRNNERSWTGLRGGPYIPRTTCLMIGGHTFHVSSHQTVLSWGTLPVVGREWVSQPGCNLYFPLRLGRAVHSLSESRHIEITHHTLNAHKDSGQKLFSI